MLNHIVLLQPEFNIVKVNTTAVLARSINEAKSSWVQWSLRDRVSSLFIASCDMLARGVLELIASEFGVSPELVGKLLIACEV